MLWTVVGKGGTEELSHSGLRTRSHHESHRLNICRLWWLLGVHFKVYLRKTDYCNTEEPKAKLATIFHKSHTQHENTGIYWAFFSLSPAYNLVQEVGRNLGKAYMSWLLKVSESFYINESLFFPRYIRTQRKSHTNFFSHNILDNTFWQSDKDNLSLHKPLRL